MVQQMVDGANKPQLALQLTGHTSGQDRSGRLLSRLCLPDELQFAGRQRQWHPRHLGVARGHTLLKSHRALTGLLCSPKWASTPKAVVEHVMFLISGCSWLPKVPECR